MSRKCSSQDKINHHAQDPSKTYIFYDSEFQAINLSFPRKYTCIYKVGGEVYVSVKESYDQRLINNSSSPEIIGEWEKVMIEGRYENQIHLRILISDRNTPKDEAMLRNHSVCLKLGPIL